MNKKLQYFYQQKDSEKQANQRFGLKNQRFEKSKARSEKSKVWIDKSKVGKQRFEKSKERLEKSNVSQLSYFIIKQTSGFGLARKKPMKY